MKTIEKLINISNIRIDSHPLNPSTLELIDFIRKNGAQGSPPVRVKITENGVYMIKDGRHRVTAFKLLGIKQILAKVSKEYKHNN